MGRGPKGVHTHLLGDLQIIRLTGVLTATEQQLVKTLLAEKGRELLKQVRTEAGLPAHFLSLTALVAPSVLALGRFEALCVAAWLIACSCVQQHGGHVLGIDGQFEATVGTRL
jgi:hypothetical protein